MTTVKVHFVWSVYRPDARQFKQQSMEVMPFIGNPPNQPEVEIELPVNLLANAEDYLKAGIEGNKEPTPIFSVAAVKYLVDEWEKAFPSETVTPDDFKPAVEDDWDEGDHPNASNEIEHDQAGTAPSNEEWDNMPGSADDNWDEVEKTETKDEQWDDSKEDWGETAQDN